MNESDSERIAGLLDSMGYSSTEGEDYDLVVYNTCCVRETAENRILGHLGNEKAKKRSHPGRVILLCGCMMQQKGMAEKILKRYPFVDIVFGTHNIHRLPALLEGYRAERPIREIWTDGDSREEISPLKQVKGYTAHVPVMRGCDNFCSYCIVPQVRGREVSRSSRDILEEMAFRAEQGAKEVTLLGQNVNSYGKHNGEGLDFADLLHLAGQVEGVERIRFMTSHPKDISEKLIRAIRDIPKACKHLHLPLQSGSTRVLREMNRCYTREQYLDVIAMVKREIPGIGLSTDVMVGFPGETEEDFLDTMDIIERVRFDFAYTFLYSRREGTPAADRTDIVPDQTKGDRFRKLCAIQESISLENNRKEIGKTLPVLVTGFEKTRTGWLTGRTDTHRLVHFRGDAQLSGRIVPIRICDGKTWNLEGDIV